VVPKVAGKTLSAARKAIVRAHCRVGTITRRRSAKVRSGRVIATRPAAGTHHRGGTKINLTVSKPR
jgi:beta-lactam-binding protein with PASTA domain